MAKITSIHPLWSMAENIYYFHSSKYRGAAPTFEQTTLVPIFAILASIDHLQSIEENSIF